MASRIIWVCRVVGYSQGSRTNHAAQLYVMLLQRLGRAGNATADDDFGEYATELATTPGGGWACGVWIMPDTIATALSARTDMVVALNSDLTDTVGASRLDFGILPPRLRRLFNNNTLVSTALRAIFSAIGADQDQMAQRLARRRG